MGSHQHPTLSSFHFSLQHHTTAIDYLGRTTTLNSSKHHTHYRRLLSICSSSPSSSCWVSLRKQPLLAAGSANPCTTNGTKLSLRDGYLITMSHTQLLMIVPSLRPLSRTTGKPRFPSHMVTGTPLSSAHTSSRRVSRPRTLPQITPRALSLRLRSIGTRLRTRPRTRGRALRIGSLTAGPSHNSRPSQTTMASQFLNPVPEILFSRRYAPAMRPLPKRLARLLHIPATGFTNPGLSLISRSGSICMASPLLNPPPATS